MLRSDISNIVNDLATLGTLDFELIKCYNLILNYCKANDRCPTTNDYGLNNGVLVINGKNIGRVDRLPSKVPFNEQAHYIEGCILARQETYVD